MNTRTPLAPLGTTAVLGMLLMSGCSGYGQGNSPTSSAPNGTPGTVATAPSPAAPPAALCDAAPAQAAVGQNSTASVMESARVRSGAQIARILRPGQMITKEFNAQRLNLEVDASGRIVTVRCG